MFDVECRAGAWDQSVTEAIDSWTLADLRASDAEEYLDCMHALGYPRESAEDTRTYLPLALGRLESPRVYTATIKVDAINYGNHSADLCVFIATLTRREGSDIGLLRGAGLAVGHKRLNVHQIQSLTEQIVDNVVWDMANIFNVKMAVCHIKNTNRRTLASWRYLAKRRPDLTMTFIPTPGVKGYTTLVLEV